LEFAQTEYFNNFKLDFYGATKAIMDKTMAELRDLTAKLKLDLTTEDLEDILLCIKTDFNKRAENRKLFVAQVVMKDDLDHIMHRHVSYMIKVNAINDGYLYFKRNNTNGRLDTNLTTLPSFLRPYIISPEPLVSIDIKNSQPYFLYTILQGQANIEPEELKKYGDIVISGRLYDFLLDEYNKTAKYCKTRDQIKEMLFSVFYSKTTNRRYKAFFGSYFPTIMKYIDQINEKDNSKLSNKLTRIESNGVLDGIMPSLGKLGIKPFTIHDSFVCRQSEAEVVEKEVREILIGLHGVAPSLTVELIDKVVEETSFENDEDKIDDNWFDETHDPIQIGYRYIYNNN